MIQILKRILPYQLRIKLRKIIFKAKYIVQLIKTNFRNDKVYCPITGKKYFQFLKYRNDLLTPSTGAWRRHRTIWLYLKNNTNLLIDNIKLFHPAPELCFYEIFKKSSNIDYYPCDLNEKWLIKIDLTDIKYPENYFDYILCNHVLEHIPNDKKAIEELYRVLKKDGKAIITVPINENFDVTYEDPTITTPAEREKHFGQWDHVRWYGIDIGTRFERVGFKVEMLKYGLKIKESNPEIYNKWGLCDDYLIIAQK